MSVEADASVGEFRGGQQRDCAAEACDAKTAATAVIINLLNCMFLSLNGRCESIERL
jgi:hypothetical protein